MLYCQDGTCRHTSSGGDPGKPGGLRQGSPWGLAGIEDRRPSSDRRRAAAWLDGPGFRADAHELEPLDPGGKYKRVESPEEQANTRAPVSVDTADCTGSRTAFRAIAPRFWPEPGTLGRPHSRRTLKAPVRFETESAASPDLDAPTGISLKTGQLYVSSSPCGRSEAVSQRVKKNFKIWGLGTRWSFRMKRDSLCIPAWDGDGRREDSLFAFPRPANISSGLIFRVGWRRFWDDTGLSARSEEIGKVS